jgi:hypothetical protein
MIGLFGCQTICSNVLFPNWNFPGVTQPRLLPINSATTTVSAAPMLMMMGMGT